MRTKNWCSSPMEKPYRQQSRVAQLCNLGRRTRWRNECVRGVRTRVVFANSGTKVGRKPDEIHCGGAREMRGERTRIEPRRERNADERLWILILCKPAYLGPLACACFTVLPALQLAISICLQDLPQLALPQTFEPQVIYRVGPTT